MSPATPKAELGEHPTVESDLIKLARLSSFLLNEHINDNGLCPICRNAIPCARAVLAEHNMALL